MKEFKIFLSKAAVLLIILIVSDVVIGFAITYVFNKQKSGKYFITTYALKNTNQDILVFGNSHAAQHFNTPLMAEKLKVSAFNFGVQGQSMLYYYPIIKSVLNYHKPKLIIMNLDCTELSFNPTNYQRLSIFLPYFHQNKYVDSSIYLMGGGEKLEAWSSLYRYNSTIGYILFNVSNKSENKSYKSLGFDPQYGNFCQKISMENENSISKKIKFDEKIIQSLSSLIKDIQNAHIPLVVTTTPLLYGIKQNAYRDKLKLLLMNSKVDYWDYANDESFVNKCNLFIDQAHLNKEGADVFTNMIMERIIKSNILNGSGTSANK
ncbi:DUF1574 domain-containing protein [Mucilaginibacter sp. BJC16-A38]|uniref:DUF1574 domain-containing protein n=1 Tax=Mucilaginibacter phenanthrenivorans TaxID=1234842 RepID=UPI002158473A|nr:DUF1574 domain-containing protein [Mucilaginibacter phenanthrenivorans]MCR8559738.1 DUF1574 domain-containing protein [Mucilaginibacter phenanthrenivorans]